MPDEDDIEAAFEAALRGDAEAPHSEMPAPPRNAVSVDPDAPHGRDEDGTPLAPFGTNKKTGRPNLKAGGPGRGKKADAPRVTTPDKAPATPATGGRSGKTDYTAALLGAGTTVWMGASLVKGGPLPLVPRIPVLNKTPLAKVRVPDLRPFAGVFHEQMPGLAVAWNQAAQQNAVVRGWVEKIAEGENFQWVLAVAVTSAEFAAACSVLAKAENAAAREAWAARNDQVLAEFVAAQAQQAQTQEAE